jgi:hypothetical protein
MTAMACFAYDFLSRRERKMKKYSHELTLTNMLTDSMVQAAMAADRVDPRELASMLARVAKTLPPSPALRPECIAQMISAN